MGLTHSTPGGMIGTSDVNCEYHHLLASRHLFLTPGIRKDCWRNEWQCHDNWNGDSFAKISRVQYTNQLLVCTYATSRVDKTGDTTYIVEYKAVSSIRPVCTHYHRDLTNLWFSGRQQTRAMGSECRRSPEWCHHWQGVPICPVLWLGLHVRVNTSICQQEAKFGK